MPIYEFTCRECDDAFEVYRALANFTREVPCQKCGGVSDLRPSVPHTDLKEFHTPIEMHSIGCTSVEQIREMQRAGVSISDNPTDPLFGTPIAHSRKEKLKALKVAGFTEAK
jgi:putative FmdB family regulatory protein